MDKRTVQKRKASQYMYGSRRRKSGFSPKECWNLDCTIIDFVLPRLKYFIENTHSYPHGMTYEEYIEKLNAIVEGFEIYNSKEWFEQTPEQTEKVILARKYFGELLYDLWD